MGERFTGIRNDSGMDQGTKRIRAGARSRPAVPLADDFGCATRRTPAGLQRLGVARLILSEPRSGPLDLAVFRSAAPRVTGPRRSVAGLPRRAPGYRATLCSGIK